MHAGLNRTSEGTGESGVPRLLVVVAHPDDETFGCGSLLLRAADQGMTTAVLCATRGEAGEIADATTPADLGAVRESETRAAAEVLGVGELHFLDFLDSGMSGPADPATLVGSPLDDVSDQVRSRIEAFRPSIVVTLDASDGHRDHERIREATLAAVDDSAWPVERVYLHCLAQSLMSRWVEHMIVHDPSWEHLRGNVPGTPEELITTVLDTSAYLEQRERAIALHASQRSPFDGLPDELRRDFLSSERLRRVRPEWCGGPIEHTLSVPAG